MGYTFKQIANKNITKHTAHKKYEIVISNSTGSFDGLNVFAYSASKNSLEWDDANNTLTTNGYAKRDIYDSIYSKFYYSGSGMNGCSGLLTKDHTLLTIDGTPTSQANARGKTIYKRHFSEAHVLTIPHLMIGDGIKPGSLKITAQGVSLVDDKKGNVMWSNTHVGNIFYEYGIIVMNYLANQVPSAFSYNTLEFKNTYPMKEHEYMCNIGKEEFNASTNHSVLSDISTKTLKSFVSSSEWNPYITTVGLYNQDNELLAIGKLGQPIKKSEKYDTSFIIRFDT